MRRIQDRPLRSRLRRGSFFPPPSASAVHPVPFQIATIEQRLSHLTLHAPRTARAGGRAGAVFRNGAAGGGDPPGDRRTAQRAPGRRWPPEHPAGFPRRGAAGARGRASPPGVRPGPCGPRCWTFRPPGERDSTPVRAPSRAGGEAGGGAPVVLSDRKRLDCLARRNPATTNVISQRVGRRGRDPRQARRGSGAQPGGRQPRRRGVRRPAITPGRPAAEPARGVRLRAAPLPGAVRPASRSRSRCRRCSRPCPRSGRTPSQPPTRDPSATSADTSPAAASAADTGSGKRKTPPHARDEDLSRQRHLVRLASGLATERNPDVDGAALPHHGRGTALRNGAREDRPEPQRGRKSNYGQACA